MRLKRRMSSSAGPPAPHLPRSDPGPVTDPWSGRRARSRTECQFSPAFPDGFDSAFRTNFFRLTAPSTTIPDLRAIHARPLDPDRRRPARHAAKPRGRRRRGTGPEPGQAWEGLQRPPRRHLGPPEASCVASQGRPCWRSAGAPRQQRPPTGSGRGPLLSNLQGRLGRFRVRSGSNPISSWGDRRRGAPAPRNGRSRRWAAGRGPGRGWGPGHPRAGVRRDPGRAGPPSRCRCASGRSWRR